MLNFAEQTGSGAVIIVWYYLLISDLLKYINSIIILITQYITTRCMVTVQLVTEYILVHSTRGRLSSDLEG